MNTRLPPLPPVPRLLSPGSLLLLCLLAVVAIPGLHHPSSAQTQAPAPLRPGPDPTGEIAALRSEIEQLKGRLPDQSHAMKDVGYHFANLWFAGQKKNWPLARFYLDEARSHLKWAVRIIPVRKTKAGDLDLRGILEAVDGTKFSEVEKAIAAQDSARFTTAYQGSLEGCYACHKAAEKPYLRPQIPAQPEAPIINFDPGAPWPP